MVAVTDVDEFLGGLTGLSDEECTSRVDAFFRSLGPEDPTTRASVMKSLIQSAGNLPPEVRRSYLKARTEVLADLPMGTKMALMGAYREILLTVPRDQAEAEIEALKSLRAELDPRHHVMLDRFIHFLPAAEADEPEPVAASAPTHASDHRPWWRFWGA